MKRFLVLPLMLFGLFSCSSQKMPQLPLVEVSYSHGSQMNRYPDSKMKILCEGDSVCAICFDQERLKYCKYRVEQPGVMEELRSVIEDYKMYKYDDHYDNKLVLDGWSWGYHARFSDNAQPKPNKAYLSSGGSNAKPRNSEGLDKLASAMGAAIRNATFLYVCNEDGMEVPDVPHELEFGDSSAVDYLYLMRNDYDGRLDYRFHDIEESETFRATFGDIEPPTGLLNLKKRAERCYGSRIIITDPKCPVLYLLVDKGGVEAVDVIDLMKEQPQTTRFSITRGLTDIQLIDGVVKGIDASGAAVDIEWEAVEK